MRLHRLVLRDVKGVRERTVDFPDHGVLVIEGPNEVGKTTLLDAFDALLSLRATSRAAAVRALQPVDRDVAPVVEAELTIGAQRVRFAKRWLRQPSTTLHVLGARPEQLTGDAAQQRLDALLDQHLDRTLWDALRLTQAGDGSVAPLVSSSVLTAALDAAAGAHQHTDGAEALLDQVGAEHALYFTATGRPTGAYRAAMTRHTQAQDAVAEAHRRVEEGTALLTRLEQVRGRAVHADSVVDRAARRLAEAELAGARVDALAAACDTARERLGHAQDRHRAAGRALQQRLQLVRDRGEVAAAVAAARAARQADLEAADGIREQLLAAEEAERATGAVLERALEEADAARADADHVSVLRDLGAREELLERAVVLVAEVRRAQDALPDRGVDLDQARGVRALQDRLDAMVLEHAATTPVVEVEALASSVEVGPAGHPVPDHVAPGEQARLDVAHDTTLEVPGQARITVRLQGEAQARAAEIDRVREELRRTLAELGARSADEVDSLAAATDQASLRLREATRDAEAHLRPWGAALAAEAGGGVLPARLTEEVDRARRQVASALAARPAGRDLPADEAVARAAVRAADQELRTAREAQRRAADAVAGCRAEVAVLTTRLDRAEGRIEAGDNRVGALDEQLRTARAETTDDALQQQLARCAEQVATAEAALRRAVAAMTDGDVAGVRAELRSAQDEHRAACRAREDSHAELNQVKGQVEMAAGEGRQELYDLSVAELDDAERELRAVDRRARAARHLVTALRRHRADAHRTYVRPYTQALEELGRRVYGAGFAVTVDEDLALSARTLDGATVPFSELSGGAKEQLGILARLAVARLVDPVQGVPVVIDDALGYSDPQRLRQMGQVLGSALARDVQVILLTCTPERYATVPGVRTVRLTA